jgi:hypothetical protein
MQVEVVVPVAFFAFLAVTVVGVTRAVSDGMTRRRLVQSNASAEVVRAVLARDAEAARRDALKYGLLVAAVGVELVVVQFLPYGANQAITYGVVLLFAAAGLLGYYAIGRRMAGLVPAV